MSHGEGWQFIQLGRYVERTDTLATLLDTHFKRVTHPVDQDGGKRANIWVGWGCCADAWRLKLIARFIRRKFVLCEWRNFCC